jgi:hypothetical protein
MMKALPLSPALFLAAASALLTPRVLDGLDDEGPGGSSSSSAAFIAHTGYWSHYRGRGRSVWPFPVTADCDELARLATGGGVLRATTPEPGAILLRRSADGMRFTHASIVLWALDVLPTKTTGRSYDCCVIEGRATISAEPSAAGLDADHLETRVQWARRTRISSRPSRGDRFVTWVDLDSRNAIGRAA